MIGVLGRSDFQSLDKNFKRLEVASPTQNKLTLPEQSLHLYGLQIPVHTDIVWSLFRW